MSIFALFLKDLLPLSDEVIGIVPAAGLATRLGPIEGSKEVMPLVDVGIDGGGRFEVVGDYLLDRMREAGVRDVYVVLRKGKWDIAAHWGNGASLGLNVAYPIMQHPYGVPFTVAEACRFVHDADIIMGFPDIVFAPSDLLGRAITQLRATRADVALALARTTRPETCDTVEVDADGDVTAIHVKAANDLADSWIAAAWSVSFTRYLIRFVEDALGDVDPSHEVPFASTLASAIEDGLRVTSVSSADSAFADLGHPQGQALARTLFPSGLPTVR